MRRPVLMIPLFLLTAFFFGWKTYETWTAPPEAGPREHGSAFAEPALAKIAETAHADELSGALTAIVERPLFRPDRRPFHENSAAAPRRNYDAELARFTVIGVVMMGAMEKAIVTGKAGGRDERYEVGPGDNLPGFQVKEVRPEGIQVTADGMEFTLPLYAGSPKPPPGGALRTEVARPAPSTPFVGTPESSPLPPAGTATPPRTSPFPTFTRPRPLPPETPAQPHVPPATPAQSQAPQAVLPPYPTPSSATYAPESGPVRPAVRRTPARR